MLSKMMIIGHVGNTPEIKDANGTKVANIQVGVTERGYTTKDGKKVEDRTDWFYVQAWRGLADIVEKYVNKGDKIYIEGRMRSRQYEKDGVKRTAWELVAENIEMLTPKKESQTAQQPAQPTPQKEEEPPLPF